MDRFKVIVSKRIEGFSTVNGDLRPCLDRIVPGDDVEGSEDRVIVGGRGDVVRF